jgi:hypothetical protein
MRATAAASFLIAFSGIALCMLGKAVSNQLGIDINRLNAIVTYHDKLNWLLAPLLLESVVLWFNPFQPLATWVSMTLHPEEYAGIFIITIDRGGVFVKTDKAEARQFWRAYSQAVETNSFFILVYGNWLYAIIPKRAFPDAKSISCFHRLLEIHAIPLHSR